MIFFKRFLDQGTLEKGELLRIIGYILTPHPPLIVTSREEGWTEGLAENLKKI